MLNALLDSFMDIAVRQLNLQTPDHNIIAHITTLPQILSFQEGIYSCYVGHHNKHLQLEQH